MNFRLKLRDHMEEQTMLLPGKLLSPKYNILCGSFAATQATEAQTNIW